MKTCSKCKTEKPFSDFYKNKDGKDGLYSICSECCLEKDKLFRKDHKDRQRKYRLKNPDKVIESHKRYYLKNKSKVHARNYKRQKAKRKNDPILRLNNNMSRIINLSLKGEKNGWKWETLVNYTQQDLRQHLENQFDENMTWQNYGEWHIDHRIPRSLFNIKGVSSKGFKKCWALENLQPLWAKDNVKKGNNLFY